MSRDIEERLALFGVDMDAFLFKRIALNMEQIEEFSPPPNPAKLTVQEIQLVYHTKGGYLVAAFLFVDYILLLGL